MIEATTEAMINGDKDTKRLGLTDWANPNP